MNHKSYSAEGNRRKRDKANKRLVLEVMAYAGILELKFKNEVFVRVRKCCQAYIIFHKKRIDLTKDKLLFGKGRNQGTGIGRLVDFDHLRLLI
ncbi:MAG: hypothetical protein R3218_03620 [Christiangramia sp.]|nr:hypothetical protein [Christiangramia sp.]